MIPDPALKEKRKAKEVDPDFSIIDEGSEEEDTPLISRSRKRSRTLMIRDGMLALIIVR
jgi:acetylornithine deacetylase/succinyl-diaminopimelate desuccinylase-like protein